MTIGNNKLLRMHRDMPDRVTIKGVESKGWGTCSLPWPPLLLLTAAIADATISFHHVK